MKLHSDVLIPSDFNAAINEAARTGKIPSCTVVETVLQGSRSRARGITFRLGSFSADRKRARNSGNYGADRVTGVKAASWDDHGHIFALLFDKDPDAIIGYYDGQDDFNHKTDWSYEL